ncbi:hypothetical protein F7725_004811 [Dissostichus mawsoni]|uniref:Peptidase S1 domain-containing protein n=1 Tax=Dissostichus mawsoni TaxID=36200 RepID=A0A7J5XLA6_DISMA|nr:hypothetical protein F7725_004811 [Dissostichus mawsoni]
MALYQFLCGSAVMIILLSNGCHSQQQPACGQAPNNPRIVGGQNAAAGSWPWVASIQAYGKHRCGGSLISDMWVLIDAYCIINQPENITVVLGLESMSGPNLNNVSKAIDKIIVHPLYNVFSDFNEDNNNDMALLKLSSPVNFTDYIQPVCLASANSTFYTGVSSWVVGFGATSSGGLRWTNDDQKGFGLGPEWRREFGKGCTLPNVPGVYVRVSQFEDWIKSHTGSSKPGFVDYMSQGVDSDLTFACPSIPTPRSPLSHHPSPPYHRCRQCVWQC